MFEDIYEVLEEHRESFSESPKDDIILKTFDRLFGDKIKLSLPLDEGLLGKKITQRYKDKIPPGYKDESKGGIKSFGDCLIWLDTINRKERR